MRTRPGIAITAPASNMSIGSGADTATATQTPPKSCHKGTIPVRAAAGEEYLLALGRHEQPHPRGRAVRVRLQQQVTQPSSNRPQSRDFIRREDAKISSVDRASSTHPPCPCPCPRLPASRQSASSSGDKRRVMYFTTQGSSALQPNAKLEPEGGRLRHHNIDYANGAPSHSSPRDRLLPNLHVK